MTRLFVLLLLVLPMTTFASDDVARAKYGIIKEAVLFLSSDTVTSPDFNGASFDCADLDYACLKTYATQNKITGVAGKVNEWSAVRTESKADLVALKNKIVQQITASKDYRTQLETYEGFRQAVNALVETVPDDAPVTDNTRDERDNEIGANEDRITDEPANEGSSNLLPWLALLASLAALGLSVFTFMKMKNAAPQDSLVKQHELNYLKEDIKALRAKPVSKPSNDGVALKPLQDKIAYLEDRLARLENQPTAANVIELDVPKKKSQAAAPPIVNEPSTLYAKLPDLGNAFSAAILTDRQNGEQIYQIEIDGDRGVFAVSEDAHVQKYALSDFNFYLPKACDFANQPTKNSRIHTVRNGTLTKSTAGWAIDTKALIEFR